MPSCQMTLRIAISVFPGVGGCADALGIQIELGLVMALLAQRDHIAPVGFGQVAVGSQHPDIAAFRLGGEVVAALVTRAQLPLLLAYQIRRQDFTGAPTEREELG